MDPRTYSRKLVYKNCIVGLANHITQVMKLYLLASLRVPLSALNRIVQPKYLQRLSCCYTLCTSAYSGEYESYSVSIIIVIPAVDNITGV